VKGLRRGDLQVGRVNARTVELETGLHCRSQHKKEKGEKEREGYGRGGVLGKKN